MDARSVGTCQPTDSSSAPRQWHCSCRLRSARGSRRDLPNREEVVRLHRLWRRLPERFGSSTGRWHSPSRQCIQRDRIRGIRCAPEIELFLFLEPVQTGRIGDPSRLSQPTPALSPRRETGLRQMIQICNCLRRCALVLLSGGACSWRLQGF